MRKQEVSEAAPTAVLKVAPRFVVQHTLFLQVTELADLPASGLLLRDLESGVYNALDRGTVRPDLLAELVASGRVYALWARHVELSAELDPTWYVVKPHLKKA